MRAIAIGGPVDGRIINSGNTDFPAFAERTARPFPAVISDSPAFSDAVVKHVRCQPFVINFGDSRTEVFVPIGQTPEDTLKKLINGYRILDVEVD
jgi:hypothetical protein